jgi:hypothetical protein
MKFTLNIELGNEAMETVRDVAEAIEASLARFSNFNLTMRDGVFGQIVDANGNTVGRWEVAD